MSEITWGVIALILILLLTFIALGLRAAPGNKSALGVSNVFEDGLLFAVFAILFAPFYLASLGLRSVWLWLRPPTPLPVDGDDPIWGRNVNQKLVETVFLAIQQARLKRNPNLAKKFISQELYHRLKRECDHPGTNHERKSIQIKEILLSGERIEKGERLCYFNATVVGTVSSVSHEADGTPTVASCDPEDFEEELAFARALPSVSDAHWQLMTMSGLTGRED